jgi:hypothetical protein
MQKIVEGFCGPYAQIGEILAWLALGFVGAAFLAAIAAVVIDIAIKLRPTGGAEIAPAPASVKDFIQTIGAFVTALSTAPIWLALLAAGVVVYWVPGAALSQVCTMPPK